MSLSNGAGSWASVASPVGARLCESATQEALPGSQNLSAFDESDGGVAHDLKNILNSVGLYLELIQRSVANGGNSERVQAHVDIMKQEIARGAQVIDRLRDHCRQRYLSRAEEIDLNDLVREACVTIRPLGSAAHRVNEELGTPPAFVGCSSDIVSALVNLLVNALDVMAEGGVVTIRTGRCQHLAWVQVADDGPGMPPEVELRAFEPFFTTKGDRGTGLGLAIVRTCMQRHSGSVKLDTSMGKGTTITLTFPAVRRTPSQAGSETGPDPADAP